MRLTKLRLNQPGVRNLILRGNPVVQGMMRSKLKANKDGFVLSTSRSGLRDKIMTKEFADWQKQTAEQRKIAWAEKTLRESKDKKARHIAHKILGR
jgi:hypothetical protein